MQVVDLDYSDYLGRQVIGPIVNGEVVKGDQLCVIGVDGKPVTLKVTAIASYNGVQTKEVESAKAGDIIVMSGVDDVRIGDTICNLKFPKALPRIKVDKPTISMRFTINTSPFSGKEGKLVQATKIKTRLLKEALMNVSIEVECIEGGDEFIVKGRGEFQLAILIE